MEVKKHKLLLMLGQTPATAVEAAPTDADGGDPLPCDPPEGTGSVHTSTEEEDKIIGMKCRAPLKEVRVSLVIPSCVHMFPCAVVGWREPSQCCHHLPRTKPPSRRGP